MNLIKYLVRQCGARALTDPEVAIALDVTETQRLRIADVVRRHTPTWRQRIRALFLDRRGRQPTLAALRGLRRELDRPITGMLNEAQRAKFEAMLGPDAQAAGESR